ncbi:MAG: hypothetical protein FWC39_09895 [Bacteroidetes bacterium]|nr:hypothetical protein [Bacteroidota bacterium]
MLPFQGVYMYFLFSSQGVAIGLGYTWFSTIFCVPLRAEGATYSSPMATPWDKKYNSDEHLEKVA